MTENPSPNQATEGGESPAVWQVLVNGQGQHALWPVVQPVPAGWRNAGPEGTEDELAAWLATHWADMRPAVLR